MINGSPRPPSTQTLSTSGSAAPRDTAIALSPAEDEPSQAVALPANRDTGGGIARTIVVRPFAAAEAPQSDPPAAEAKPGGAADAANRDVTLNFAGADIRDVIAAILGKTLKLNYVIDPAVRGPVNFNVSRPLSRDEVLPTLEAVLNSRGATMVKSDGIIRVLPMQKAGTAGAVATPIGRAPDPGEIGERSEVFPLRYVAAADMQHLLEKVLPPGRVIVADEPHRLVLVQGSPDELRVAADTVGIFDIDQLSGMSMALVPLHNADPAEMSAELKNIFGSDKDRPSDVVRFMAIKRLDAVMVLTRSPRYLDEARAWIDRLDRARDVNARRVYVYYLQYAKAVDVGEKLQSLLTSLNVQFKAPAPPAGNSAGIGAGDKAAAAPGAGPSNSAPAVDASPPPSAAVATGAAPTDPDDDSSVRIEADETHNALLVSATARDYELIRQVLEGIDTPPLQVLIKVTIAEVTLNNTLQYGVQAFLQSGNALGILFTGTSTTGITPNVPGFAAVLSGSNLQPRLVLQALSDLTQTRVLETPRLLVLSNQTARLQVGDVVPIITQSATATTTSNPLIVNNIQYKETGVVLSVTPRVNAGGYVTMDINQSVSDVVNTTTSNIDSPTFEQRQLTSTVSVKSGHSILLGGLIQNQDNRDSSGIPYLHEIPGIGALFGNHNNSTTQTELIMFLTPEIIRNGQDAQDITQQMERQLDSVLDASTMVVPRAPPP